MDEQQREEPPVIGVEFEPGPEIREHENAAAEEFMASVEDLRRDFRERSIAIGNEEPAAPALSEPMELQVMLERFLYVRGADEVADRLNPRRSMSVAHFHNATASSKTHIANRNAPLATSKLWLADPRRKQVETRTFHPGAPEYTRAPNGELAINTWKVLEFGPPPEDWDERIKPFLAHFAFLFPDPAQAGRSLDWFAHALQFPGVRPHWHLLHVTDQTQGIGRNWLAGIIARIWRGQTAMGEDLPRMSESGFNGGISGKIFVIVDEINEGHGANAAAYRFAEYLKSLLTATQVTINPKYGKQFVEYSCARFLMFSNHLTAVPLTDRDRRMEVAITTAAPKDAAYYRELYRLADEPAFIRSIAEYLARRDLSAFNPGARPGATEGRRRMIEATASPLTMAMQTMLKHWPGDLLPAAIATKIIATIEGDEFARPNPHHLRHAMRALGIAYYKGRVTIEIPGGASRAKYRDRLWILREASAYEGAEPITLGEIATATCAEAEAGRWHLPEECPIDWAEDGLDPTQGLGGF